MRNLLPQEEQKNIIREYRLRLATTSLLFLAALGSVACIALVPSLFISNQKEKLFVKNSDALSGEINLGAKDNLASVLKLTEKKLAVLAIDNKNLPVYEIIEKITGDRTSGIKITAVSVKSQSEGDARDITVSGIARDRDALLSFARVLGQEKVFVNVTVPVSNFAPVADIEFSILAATKVATTTKSK